jgi:hypothetical protein
MKTINTDVFTFDELDEKAKEKARDWMREGYPDHGWWEDLVTPECSNAVQSLKDAGIEVDARGLSFDLDRADFICFEPFRYEHKTPTGHTLKGEHKGIWVEYPDKLADEWREQKIIGDKIHRAITNGDILVSIDTRLYGGGYARNYIELVGDSDIGYELVDKISDAQSDDQRAWFNGNLDAIKKELRAEFEYLTSDENIDDILRANEYTFTKDGKRFG